MASSDPHLSKCAAHIFRAVLLLPAAHATAGTPEKNKSWDELIAQAKAHGGTETKLDRAASWVFQRPDGAYVTFTRMLDGSKRAVCAIDKGQNVTVCADWDSGKINWSERKDVASPWIFHRELPDEAALAMKPLESLWSTFLHVIGTSRKGLSGNLYRSN